MTQNYARKLLFMMVLMGIANYIIAQNVTIEGVITDNVSKKPILGVSVIIGEGDGEGGGESDSNGKYSAEIDTKGRTRILLKALLDGYAPYEAEVLLGSSPIVYNFTMLPTTFTTDEIVVSATKGAFDQQQKDVPVSIAVVKQQSINLQATANVDKVITQIPGVDNLDGQLSIRGSSGYAYGVGSRVMVLLDGLPLLTGDAGNPEFSLVPLDNISQVEVMKGASSVMYGSAALGGVINVITGDAGDKPKTSIRLRQGMYSAPRNRNLDWDNTSSAYNISGHFYHQRKVGNLSLTAQLDLIKDSGYRFGTDKEEVRAILHTKYQPKKIPGLTVGANFTFRSDSSGTSIFYNRYYPSSVNILYSDSSIIPTTDTLHTYVGGGLYPNSGAGVYRKQLNTRFAVDPVIKYLTPNGKSLFWYRGRFLINNNVNNTGQGSASSVTYNDFLYQTKIKEKINWVSGFTVAHGTTNSPELCNGSYSQTSMGIYTQLDARFGRLNATLGGRLETVKTNIHEVTKKPDSLLSFINKNIDIIQKRQTQPVFRAGLNYELARATNVRASFGQAFRVPTIAEYFAATGAGGVKVNPNLYKKDSSTVVKPENGFSTEIGLRQGYAFGPKEKRFIGFVDVAGFMMRYNQMMEFGLDTLWIQLFPTKGTNAYFSTRNVTDARITGFEFTTINSYATKNFQFNFSGGVTYLVPINLNAVAEKNQLDLSYFNISAFNGPAVNQMVIDVNDTTKFDQPKELKYRNRTLVRASGGIQYKQFGFNANYRYRSFMKSVDQYLYLVVGDMADFRKRHTNDEHVFDFILSYDITNNHRLNLAIDNVFNKEYTIIPGTLGEQRKFTLQYQVTF